MVLFFFSCLLFQLFVVPLTTILLVHQLWSLSNLSVGLSHSSSPRVSLFPFLHLARRSRYTPSHSAHYFVHRDAVIVPPAPCLFRLAPGLSFPTGAPTS